MPSRATHHTTPHHTHTTHTHTHTTHHTSHATHNTQHTPHTHPRTPTRNNTQHTETDRQRQRKWTEKERNIVLDRCINPETWKAVKGSWDGSFKDKGKSGCGVVIQGIDRGRWVTVTGIAVPSKVCTSMAAEGAGVCVLTGILDLIFCKILVCTERQPVHQQNPQQTTSPARGIRMCKLCKSQTEDVPVGWRRERAHVFCG